MVRPRCLAAALSWVSVPVVLIAVMSLPPVMKKRDGPLEGDSPACCRAPKAGAVSLGYGIAVVLGFRCVWLLVRRPLWEGSRSAEQASTSGGNRLRHELGTAVPPIAEGDVLCA